MDLDIRTPLEPNFLPTQIAEIVATGGIRYSDFLMDSDTKWTAYPGDCVLCMGRLDSSSNDCRDSVWNYLGRGELHLQDRYIITTPPCNHHFHAGCFHEATQQGSRMNKCPICRAKWFDTPEDLQKGRNVNFVVRRMMNGEFSLPSTRSIRLQSYDLTESLVIAAYALRTRISTYNAPEITQHGPTVLTAIISLARANDGARVDVHGFLTQLSARATRVTYGIYTKRPGRDPPAQAITLQSFASEVLTIGLGYYLTG